MLKPNRLYFISSMPNYCCWYHWNVLCPHGHACLVTRVAYKLELIEFNIFNICFSVISLIVVVFWNVGLNFCDTVEVDAKCLVSPWSVSHAKFITIFFCWCWFIWHFCWLCAKPNKQIKLILPLSWLGFKCKFGDNRACSVYM